MKVHEILAEESPKGVAFEIFIKMLPKELSKAALKEIDDALRWLARTAKSNPTVVEDLATSWVAGSKQLGISVREMAQMAEPICKKAGIDEMDIYKAKVLAEKLAEPSMWQKFKDMVGLGSKKDPLKPAETPKPGEAPAPAPKPGEPPAPTPTPEPAPTTTPKPSEPPAPATPTRIAELQSTGRKWLEKYNPKLMSWWQRADVIAMAYGIIEPWYTFKKDAEWAIGAFTTQAKNPDGSLIFKTKEELSKGVQQAAQEAMAQTLALIAGRKIIGYFTGVNRLRALDKKTQDEINAIYSTLGAKGQVAFAAWLDTPPGRRAFDGWLWGQLYSQTGQEDTAPDLALSLNSVQGQVAWAMRQVSKYLGGFVKSFYDEALRAAGGVDSQGNNAAQAQQQQNQARDSIPGGGVIHSTTEK